MVDEPGLLERRDERVELAPDVRGLRVELAYQLGFDGRQIEALAEQLPRSRRAEELPDAPGLKQAIEAVQSLISATDAEVRTALSAFRLDELKDRDGAYWLQLLLAEIGARREVTRIEEQARFAKASEHKANKKAEARRQAAAAKHEASRRRTRKKPA